MLLSFKYIDTNKAKYLVFSAIVFFFALMSKETSICFVGIMPLSLYFFRETSLKKIAIAVAPYLIISAIYMGMRAAFIESDGEKVRILVNNNALMAAANYGEKLATALFIQLKYLQLLIFPHPLSYDYSYNQIPIIDFTNPKGLLSLLVFIGLSAFALIKLPKKNIYAYSILFYFALVVLTSNLLVDIGATMAERFVYSASLGFCIALVFGVLRLLKVDTANMTMASAKTPMAVFAIIALLYSVKTVARNEAWSSNLALYETGIETADNSWRAHNLLGVEYTKMISAEKDPKAKYDLFRKSVYHFDRSLEILPGSPEVMLLKGYAYDFMGGHDDSAVLAYSATLKMDTNSQQAANNLGAVYLRQGKFAEAISILSRVVAKDPNYTEGMVNLAASYGNSGNFKESINYYERAYKINPNPQKNVLQSMSNVYRFLGDSVNSRKFGVMAASAK
jgi:tetratricopeptide (TPR) repeat protein